MDPDSSPDTDHDRRSEIPEQDLSLDAFRTDIDVFSGPLELLMYLIRRDEVNILDIPISRITDQYLKALRTLQLFDVNVAAEFMVMAATLMDAKSRSLLPDNTIDDEKTEEDPRDELVHQLLEYKKFKKASAQLRDLASVRARQFTRVPPEPSTDPEPVSADTLLEDITVWELLSAYGKVMREIEMSQPQQIVYDEVPIREYMTRVMERVSSGEEQTDFLSFFEDNPPRSHVIGVFLALLELVRQHEIKIEQPEGDRTQIVIKPIEKED
ncbi:MAG: segregation and condensation protein A, partial [Planctomycetota bacterium]